MYESFYGLNEKPFNLTPDPRFLYLSVKHKEAFAHLLYGIQSRGGFVMVSGEIGTGKTTICRSLLKQLDPDVKVAFIFNPKLSPKELLRTINSEFGIPSDAATVLELINELNKFLLDRAALGNNCVLIIDEAQNLDTETLEQIRLLSNLETETEKLLQIVLIGQPELPALLELPELRQLNQRIVARYHLDALDEDETIHYIAFRLRVAGGRKRVRFTRRAVRMVYRISQGTPRVINAICDRALLIGYTKEAHIITPKLIKQAAREIQGDRHIREVKLSIGRALPASAFVTFSAVVVLAALAIASGPLPTATEVTTFARDQWSRIIDRDDVLPAPTEELSPSVPTLEFVPDQEKNEIATVIPPAVPEPIIEVETAPVSGGNIVDAASIPDGSLGPTGTEILDKAIEEISETLPPVIEKSTNASFVAILDAWNLNVGDDLPEIEFLPDMRRYALSNGLSVAELSSSLAQIELVNLPVLILLKADTERWVALTQLRGGSATIVGSDGEASMTARELEEIYAGQCVYFWADFSPGMIPLRANERGMEVLEFQKGLSALGLLDGPSTSVYDGRTIDVVSKIQRTAGLMVDGVVGPRTRMVIDSWLEDRPTPGLAAESMPSETRERILASPGLIISGADDSSTPIHSTVEPESELMPLKDVPAEEDSAALPEFEIEFVPERESDAPENVLSSALSAKDAEIETIYGRRVQEEELGRSEYQPQLSVERTIGEDSVTEPAGRILPIRPTTKEQE